MAFEYHLAANNSEINLSFLEFFGRYLKDISVDDNEVSKLACFDRSQLVRPVEAKALDATLRVTVNGLLKC